MKKIRVAIIGCGSISDIYMSNIQSGKFSILELAACSDLFPAENITLHRIKTFRKAALDEAIIDEAVLRILELKNALGLFENPYLDPMESARVVGAEEYVQSCRSCQPHQAEERGVRSAHLSWGR